VSARPEPGARRFPGTRTVGRTARYRGRFAPSPTGPLHFGSLIAALGSYLEARAHDGEWLLRVEDLDRPRCVVGAADTIMRELDRLGLHWDGTPVYQSARLDLYGAALEKLAATDLSFPCACSRRDLRGGVYPGTCRGGIPPGRRMRSLRVRTRGVSITFRDRVQGTIHQDLETEVGDFVVHRADGIVAYHLAVVVDDARQAISDVVRGADLIDSTARQRYLQRALDLPTPGYAHLPVVLDADRRKLSKRSRATPIAALAPGAALCAALRFLGHPTPSELAREQASEVLRWARRHWRLERVPRRESVRWTGIDAALPATARDANT